MKKPLDVGWPILALLLLFSSPSANAQQVERWIVGGGGGVEGSNSEYVLTGTAGQSIVGVIVQSDRNLEQGFWHGIPAKLTVADQGGESVDAQSSEQSVQCMPNPATHTARITVTVPAGEHMTLELYDDLGRKMKTLVDRTVETSELQLSLDCDQLSEGAYLLHLATSTTQSVTRFVVVR